MKAKKKCSNKIIQATNQYVNSFFRAISFLSAKNINPTEKLIGCNCKQKLSCQRKPFGPE